MEDIYIVFYIRTYIFVDIEIYIYIYSQTSNAIHKLQTYVPFEKFEVNASDVKIDAVKSYYVGR